jgi:archaellum component FlaG (FlaF/FlaG flagellin family)
MHFKIVSIATSLCVPLPLPLLALFSIGPASLLVYIHVWLVLNAIQSLNVVHRMLADSISEANSETEADSETDFDLVSKPDSITESHFNH